MFIGAALIELALSERESIKARRSLARAVKDRLRQRFNLSVAEVGDPDDRGSVCVGCVAVGVDPRHVRSRMEQVVRFVEGLCLAELIGEDIIVVRLDELEEVALDDPDEGLPWEEE